MRGGLDDALARMARREELRRRVSDAQASPAAALEEVVQAARRAVIRDPELSVTVTVAYRGRTSALRVEYENGEVTVTVPGGRPEPIRPIEMVPPAPPRPVMSPPPPPPPVPAPSPPSPLAPTPLPTIPPQSAASQLAELLRHSDTE